MLGLKNNVKRYCEIGSEFWDIPQTNTDNGIFPETTQWFLSGRSALQAIIKELKDCHTVALPSWCCDSMVKPFVDAGMEVRFYPVYWENGIQQQINTECDVLFLMDYFGYTSARPNLSGYNGIVIRDITHSIFSATYSDADYYFGSLRKWCGFWTGGFAWTGNGHKLACDIDVEDKGYTALREKAMLMKFRYINGYDGADKSYLNLYNSAEDILENIDVVRAAEQDVQMARRLDVESIRTKRRANAEILRRAFSDWLLFPQMTDTDCPMFVPILVSDGKRDALRKHLINNEIYCPVHWPVSEYHRLDERTKTIYTNELSLVCDQRYAEDDMNRMVEAIRTFWKEI